MRILGIDPGLRITGYGAVQLADGQLEPTLVEAGIIRLDAKQSMETRLVQLHNDLEQLLDELKPDHVAVEKLYSHYKHPRTAILMAHARGVILLAARRRDIDSPPGRSRPGHHLAAIRLGLVAPVVAGIDDVRKRGPGPGMVLARSVL